MKNSFRFFSNTDCEYFPCHKTKRPEQFNCLFCFCPLYLIKDCGGNFRILESGVKDCTPCLIPHTPKGYDFIVARLRKRIAEVRESSEEDA